jgi:hypothetical protein
MSIIFIRGKCMEDREVLGKMNDEEFNKKLESILGNLYRIDREVREYLDKERLLSKSRGYTQRPVDDDSKVGEEYKNNGFKTYNKRQQSL